MGRAARAGRRWTHGLRRGRRIWRLGGLGLKRRPDAHDRRRLTGRRARGHVGPVGRGCTCAGPAGGRLCSRGAGRDERAFVRRGARGREARWEGRPGGPRGAFCVRKRPTLTFGAPAVGQCGAAVAGPCVASQVETRLAGPADPPGAVAAPHGARSLARDAAHSLEGAGRGEPDRGDRAAADCLGLNL